MSFYPPTFNITCNVWHQTPPVVGPPDLAAIPCALMYPKKDFGWLVESTGIPTGYPQMYLLLAALTDIRGDWTVQGFNDTIECPAGSGRFYQVDYCDDVAKGYPNEYRCAQISTLGNWPVPVP